MTLVLEHSFLQTTSCRTAKVMQLTTHSQQKLLLYLLTINLRNQMQVHLLTLQDPVSACLACNSARVVQLTNLHDASSNTPLADVCLTSCYQGNSLARFSYLQPLYQKQPGIPRPWNYPCEGLLGFHQSGQSCPSKIAHQQSLCSGIQSGPHGPGHN